MQAPSFFIGAQRTPPSVKWVIWITVAVSLLSPVLTYFLARFYHLPGPGAWLSLSLNGLNQGWVWQPFTYFFLHTAGVGLSISLLISLFFHMLLLWFAGSEVASRFGTTGFLLSYLSAGVAAGLVSTGALYLFSSQAVLVGSAPAVSALITLWAMIYPDLELSFFFLIRIQAKWLVALYLGFSLLIHLSYGEFIPLIALVTGILWAFVIGRLIWKLPNPFPLNLNLSFKRKPPKQSKIIDITVLQEDDDAFMDRMLEKISRSGEASLTSAERERMEKISQKRRMKDGGKDKG